MGKSTAESLGKIICKVCGREVDLKVNILGLVYIYCRNKLGVREDNSAIICGHQERFGIEPSKIAYQMYIDKKPITDIYEFLQNYKQEETIEPKRTTAGNTSNTDEFEPIRFDW